MGDAAVGVLDTRMTLLNGITIPTRIPSYDFRASGEAATMVQDVEKQVFADCTDRGTTALWVESRRARAATTAAGNALAFVARN
jgi:hypothetical protein